MCYPCLCLNPSPQRPVAPVPSASQPNKGRGISRCALCPMPSQPALQPASLVRAPGVCAACHVPSVPHMALLPSPSLLCGDHSLRGTECAPFHSSLSHQPLHGGTLQQNSTPRVACRPLHSFLSLILHPHACSLPRTTRAPKMCCRLMCLLVHHSLQHMNLNHVNLGTGTVVLENGLN